MSRYRGPMITACIAVVSLFLCFGQTCQASIVLTFEGLGNLEPVNSYYNGGLGGFGSGPGPSDGITFTNNSLAIIDSAHGGTGNFSNPPSGDTVLFFLNGPAATMNVPGGFTTGFSFFYADQVGFTGTINVWSGLNATGSLLATLSLPSTPSPYTVFVPIGVTFSGTAQSVDFGGSANFIAFDDITLGSATPGSAVPEPTSLALFGLMTAAGAGFGAWRRRKAATV